MSLLNQTAPDFTLINSEQEEVSLSEYVGKKIVLVFYPAAFSGICDREMCVFEDLIRIRSARIVQHQLGRFS